VNRGRVLKCLVESRVVDSWKGAHYQI
jgi:hypothetical protein